MKIDRYNLFNIKQITKGNNMNNLKKIGLTALGTALVASSAQAASMRCIWWYFNLFWWRR